MEVPVGTRGSNQRARTRDDLLDAAELILQKGEVTGLADVARLARVSRATAYRYFSGPEDILNAWMEREVDRVRLDLGEMPPDPEDRVERSVRADYRSRHQHEAALRRWCALSMMRAGRLGADHVPRGGRLSTIRRALEPLDVEPALRIRLERALAVLFGLEALVVLKDICGVEGEEAEDVLAWAARTLVRSVGDESRTSLSSQ